MKFNAINLSDPRVSEALSEQWYTREVQGDVAIILQKNWEKMASYPVWADAYISFDERLKDIPATILRCILKEIYEIISLLHIAWSLTEEWIFEIEQELVNKSRTFLYWLAQLWIVSNETQRGMIIDNCCENSDLNLYYL